MAYEEKFTSDMPHGVTMENRTKLAVTGVEDVESFDEDMVTAITTMGTLIIRGQELQIEKLSLDSGEILIKGNVDSLEYEEPRQTAGGFFSRMFR